MSRLPLDGRWSRPILGLALLAPSLAGQTIKLSAPLARPIGGDVIDYVLSPDGDRVAYVADQEQDDVVELFVTKPTGAGPSLKLSDPGEGDVRSGIRFSPDGRRIVYGTGAGGELFELHSVSVHGGAPIELDTEVWQFPGIEISSDSKRVMYTRARDLYSVPIDGSAAPIQLDRPQDTVTRFRTSPDARWCVFLADQNVDGKHELYSVPLDGSAPARKISGLLVPAGDVTSFEIDPRSRRVVYRADQEANERFELYTTRIDGRGEPSKLNAPLVDRGDVAERFEIDTAGMLVVFLAQQPALDGPDQLYSAPLDGARPPIKLSARLGNWSHNVYAFTLDPQGKRAVYSASLVRPGTSGSASLLFSVPLDGSRTAVRLSEVPVYEGGVASVFEISPDGQRVVYLDHDPAGFLELHAVPIDASADPVELGGRPMPSGFGANIMFQISPDGTNVVYAADHDSAGVFELFSISIEGGARPAKLNADFVFDGDLNGFATFLDQVQGPPFAISADGRRVIYLADQEANEVFELFSVPTDGRKPPVKLNGPLPLGPVEGDVQRFAVTADGKRAVYLADQDADEMRELYSVTLDGLHSPRELNDPLAEGASVWTFRITSDGAWVLYVARHAGEAGNHLYGVPVDRSSRPIDLCGPLVAGGNVFGDFGAFDLTPDGRRVVYRADAERDETFELFSVPIDGSERPVKLNGPLVTGGDVGSGFAADFRITPDGSRVVYPADQDTDDVLELYSVPTDASAPPAKLNSPLVPGGDVAGYEIGPGGNRVVYLTQDRDASNELVSVRVDGAGLVNLSSALPRESRIGHFEIARGGRVVFNAIEHGLAELYSVPIAGGLPAKLNALVRQFEISPDGSRVVYTADQETDNVIELYSTPIDASAMPVKLNPPLAFGVDVDGLRISPDGTRVLFHAGALYSVPIDASSPSVVLHLPTGPFIHTRLPDFQFSRDGASVLFLASLVAFPITNDWLLLAPVDGSTPTQVVVEPPSVQFNDGVIAFEPTPDGTRVVHSADLDSPGVIELYVTALPRPR